MNTVVNEELTQLQPGQLWRNFLQLCRIPRPSKQEEKAIQFVIERARSLGLDYQRDRAGNIIVRKPATKGHESAPGIVLQSHLDMVAQKADDSDHDFSIDPILPDIVAGWVQTSGTTLGADNGIGVAAMLAVLESASIVHGPLECLFTVEEEVGLSGAFAFEKEQLGGAVMLNLDSETEGDLFVGCAGSVNIDCLLPLSREAVDGAATVTVEVSVTGLKGGHSGLDIHRPRANVNKLLFEFVEDVCNEGGILVSGIDTGGPRNAISRSGSISFTLPRNLEPCFLQKLENFKKRIISEYAGNEPDLHLQLSTLDGAAQGLSADACQQLAGLIRKLPNGVVSTQPRPLTGVHTSNNIARVVAIDDGVLVEMLARSSSDEGLDQVVDEVRGAAKAVGAVVSVANRFPGWEPSRKSLAREKVAGAYRTLFGEEINSKVMHAGLECGLLGSKYPHLDMVSFGPTIRDAHSPEEKVHVESVGKFWMLLCASLEALASNAQNSL